MTDTAADTTADSTAATTAGITAAASPVPLIQMVLIKPDTVSTNQAIWFSLGVRKGCHYQSIYASGE